LESPRFWAVCHHTVGCVMLEPKQYAEWIHNDVFLPTVVVVGTEAAKRKVQEVNGLSLAELFTPFGGHYRKITVQHQALEKQLHIEGFRVHFVDAGSASQWSSSHAEQISAWTVESSSTATATGDLHTSLRPPSPWYEQWRMAMFRSLRWSEHEGLDQPVAALYVVLSTEPEPVALLEQLLQPSHMPPLCTQGVLDPVPARATVLLQDVSDPASPSSAQLQERLELIKSKFMPHLVCSLQINRGGTEVLQEVQELFQPFIAARSSLPPPPPSSSEPVQTTSEPGRCLSREDLDELGQIAYDVVTRSAVPWMQQQLQQLEVQVSQSRKGFRNQFRYLWRKPRETGVAIGQQSAQLEQQQQRQQQQQQQQHDNDSIYPLHTVEGQMRLAGDLAFLLRDYETALGYYRSVVGDFKQDRSWKHAAGAYEMWGVCTYVTGAPRSEWSRCMESAYDHYCHAAAGRHAMRAVALHQAMVSDCKDAAARLMKVNGDMADTGLRKALILEQAGQLYCQAGQMRKGTFHVVLAGHTFNKQGFKRLALSSYQSVIDFYISKNWFHITDHFLFTMARQAYGLGLLEESMSHFLSLLNSFGTDKRMNVQVQADREATYLKEFLFVVKNCMEKFPANDGMPARVDLQVPCVGVHILVILPSDVTTVTDSTPAGVAVVNRPGDAITPGKTGGTLQEERPGEAGGGNQPPASVPIAMPWESLAERLLKPLATEDRLELQWRHLKQDRVFDSLQRVAAVGEEVIVELELSNPMRVRLELSQVRLGGELLAEPETGGDGASSDKDGVAADFPEQSVVLEPHEKKRVRLPAVPRRDGLLQLRSVSWNLFGQVPCSRPLAVKGRRLRNTLEQRASSTGVYSTDHRLELRTRSGVPRLRAKIEGWPSADNADAMLTGEMRACALVITSPDGTGPGRASRIRITTSHPAFLDFDLSSSVQHIAEVTEVACVASAEPLRLPGTLRADLAGLHAIRLCILVEATGGGSGCELKQWLTLEEQLLVDPSFICSVRPSPSFQEDGKLILTCVMENQSSEKLEVQSIKCCASASSSSSEASLRQLPLQELVSSASSHHAGPGKLVQLTFSMARECLSSLRQPEVIDVDAVAAGQQVPVSGAAAGGRLLHASQRAAAAAAGSAEGGAISGGRREARCHMDNRINLIVSWCGSDSKCKGEVYVFGVPCERPGAAPCPLDMHLLAAKCADFVPGLTVPVTLQVKNTTTAGPVSFYYVTDAMQEIVWLGCERSHVIVLPPLASHTATVHAHFTSVGVFNINRFRLFVVAMPPGAGAVPASEQAPLAFQFPFERLIHIR